MDSIWGLTISLFGILVIMVFSYLQVLKSLSRWQALFYDEKEAYDRMSSEALRLATKIDSVVTVANASPETTVWDALRAAGFAVDDSTIEREMN